MYSRCISMSFLAGCLLVLASCGHGDGDETDPVVTDLGSVVTAVDPDPFSSDVSTTLAVHGEGFGDSQDVTVRFTAATGSPFQGGTSSTVDVVGHVVDDTTVEVPSPAATLCPFAVLPLSVIVIVPGPGGSESAPGTVSVAGPEIESISPSAVVPGAVTVMTITGTGIGPGSGSATVRFTATSGTPFLGGVSATVDVLGTVESDGSITVDPPVANGPASANVQVVLPSGSCTATPGPAVTFGAVAGDPGGGTPPTVTFSVPGDMTVQRFDTVAFTVTVTGSEGAPFSLRLLDPPAGATFPTASLASGGSATFRWTAMEEAGPVALTFEAAGTDGARALETVVVHLNPLVDRRSLSGDVTGDGTADLVVAATGADVAGVADTGAIYVWAGATPPSGRRTAILTATGGSTGARLGSGGLRLLDVTGDGVLDVVAATEFAGSEATQGSGAIYVWRGGATLRGDVAATATLTVPGIGPSAELASSLLLWRLGDVTGDATADVVAAAPAGETDGGPANAGAVFVWSGGTNLTGALEPSAVLVSGSAAPEDRLGEDGIELKDLSGDGVLDVLAGAANADVSGTVDVGALFLWRGGATLTGRVTPSATMSATGAASGAALGANLATTVRLEDVSGDGTPDVVAAVPGASVGAASRAGAVYVWRGGASLTGSKAPDATLASSASTTGDALGTVTLGTFLVADVTGDSTADVIAGSASADTAAGADTGAWFVWAGGASLSGTAAPSAVLSVPGAVAGDALGSGGARVADLSGDGTLDVVISAPLAGALDTGAVYVWRGGAALTGTTAATATLAVADAAAADHLGMDVQDRWFAPRFADVTGDGTLDAVVPAAHADVGAVDTGAVYVWAGGATLTGSPAAAARLTAATPVGGDRLSDASAANVVALDVSGDGTADVLVGASDADVAGVVDAGAIFVFHGGAALSGNESPSAMLYVPGAAPGDRLAGSLGLGIAYDVADLTGDGVRDVVAVAPLADVGAATDAGHAYLWSGGSMSGAVAASLAMGQVSPSAGDRLGSDGSGGDTLLLTDVTGDSKLDVVIGGPLVDVLFQRVQDLLRIGAGRVWTFLVVGS